MIFISYATKGNYEKVMSTHLRPTLEKFQLKHSIEIIDDMQNWNMATAYKPFFILKMLNKYKEDVVFLDADATIMDYPSLLFALPPDTDIGAHFFDWYLHWRNQKGNPKRELLSGTMFLRNNEKIRFLLKEYISDCAENPTIWEQKILQSLLEVHKDITIFNLPASYCAVVGRDNKVPKYVGDPVIVHWQKSREFKR